MIQHHPEDATLLAYAAGALPAAMALVVGCHLESCRRCRQAIADAEDLGGALIDELAPQAMQQDARQTMLQKLDLDPAAEQIVLHRPEADDDRALPRKLQRLLGSRPLDQHRWRSAGPGVRMLKLDCSEGQIVMLDIAAHHKVPVHSHHGNELTLILNGDYEDKLGRFATGDIADLDHRIEHQPQAGARGCLCLAGLDAPVRYKALIPRLLQPLFKL